MHPPLVLPESLKVAPLKLPVMAALAEDESSVNYGSYKEEPLPVFVFPHQDPLPVWVEPHLAEFPEEPKYLVPEFIPPPVLDPIPSFRMPLMDPRPCEKSYYELGKDERGVCDGLCSKHGHKHHFVPGQQRREPCFAKPPLLLALPPAPFPGAEIVSVDIKDVQLLAPTGFEIEDSGCFLAEIASKSHACGLPIIPEPSFQPPPKEPLPSFQPPALKEEPVYEPLPSPRLPPWREPKSPHPLGWLYGQRPVFLIDCGAAMGAERMEAVQKCLQEMFCPGGQIAVAATHFDIIMYSFDAWSYGDIENSYIYKQASGSRYSRTLEPMRVKTPDALESALSWVTRWRPAGTSNLWKALNLATSRTFADCIYLFSEGKADKPVLILEFLRQQAQMQGGHCTPIYTIGLRTSKPKCRFLKRLSVVTGGHFIEYDYKQSRKPQEDQSEEMQDMIWAQAMVEAEQRRNAEAGKWEDIKEIIKRVEKQYEPARLVPRLQAYKQRLEEHETLHHSQVQAIRNENMQKALQAKESYEQLIMDITERNHINLQTAKEKWEEEVEKVRCRNKLMIESFLKWRHEMNETTKHNEQLVNESKRQFVMDLNKVEVQNASTMEKAKQQYRSEVDRIKKRHRDALEDVARRQKEIDEKVASINKASCEEYEGAVNAIQASNAALLSRTHLLHEEQLEWVKAQNTRAIQEAQMSFAKHCEEVRTENARKKVALAQRLEDIKRRREEAIAAHQLDVSKTITEHGETVKAYTALNSENEAKARLLWKKACNEIDKQNNAADQKAKQDFEADQIYVQEENVKLAERRLEVKRHIAEVVKSNDELVKRKRLEWKEACAEVEKEYEKEVIKAKEVHKRMVEEVKLRNAEKLQSSLVDHKSKVAAVESYNETVRPYVEASNAVRAEIRRIEAFLRCIADSVLPQDRHILEKNPSKSPLETDLDLLAVSEVTLNTQMLIEALRSAYGKNLKTDKKGDKRMSQKKLSGLYDEQGSYMGLSGLIPVNPARAVSHNCLNRHHAASSQGEYTNPQMHVH